MIIGANLLAATQAAGNPSRAGDARAVGRNILLASGAEITMLQGMKPYWTDQTSGNDHRTWYRDSGDVSARYRAPLRQPTR